MLPVAATIALWVGLLWGPVASVRITLASAALAGLLALRASVWGALGLLTTAFLLGTQLPEPAASVATKPGTARVTLSIFHTNCGEPGRCWSEGRLLQCTAIDTDACPAPPAQSLAVGLVSAQEPPLGSVVTLVARMRPRQTFRNFGPTPWAGSVALVASQVAGGELSVATSSMMGRALTALRVKIRAALDGSLGAPHAGIARALLLGDAGAVDRELDASIRQAGVSHVLAVSGMHVTVLAGALVLLVRWLWLWTPLAAYVPAERVAAAAGVALSPAVACLCGGAPSAWRAAATSALVYLARAAGRSPCPIRTTTLAVGLYAALSPAGARHPGFILSVLATVALLTSRERREGLLGAAAESARAWVSTAPYLAWAFGNTSFVALAANVVLLPLGGALIPLGVMHLGAALAGLGGLTAWAFEAASGCFVGASRLLAEVDPAASLPPLSPMEGALLAVAALVWLVPLRLRTRASVGMACALLLAATEWTLRHPLRPGQARITFLDVGQGDATLLETAERVHVLVDGGGAPQGGPDPGAAAVLPALRALRIPSLDAVVLSHPHPDHYGGLFAVLASIPVHELWDTGQAEAEGGGKAAELLALARRRGTRIVGPAELCAGPRRLGGLVIEVVAPCPHFDEARGANDNSFVLRVHHGDNAFLLAGDVEAEAEADLARLGARLSAQVLKVPHHGSRTSSSTAFLAAVSPRYAVVSAGRANRFGHPHAEVAARLTEGGRELLRTDERGAVRITSDGKQLSIETASP